MIFTVGYEENYLKAIKEYGEGTVFKIGKQDQYPGGCSFQSFEDAERYIEEQGLQGYSVFGLDADWEKDTESSQDGWWHDLLRDAAIILLNN